MCVCVCVRVCVCVVYSHYFKVSLAAFIFCFLFSGNLMLFACKDTLQFSTGVGRVLANGPGDRGSILGGVIRKTQKMILDAS